MPMNRSLVGRSYPATRYRITAEATERYARATNETNPRFLDAESSGGLIAPPVFPVVYHARALAGPIGDPALNIEFKRALHGEQEMVFDQRGEELHVGEGEAPSFGQAAPPGSDQGAAVEDHPAGLVAEQVGVDVAHPEGPRALDDEPAADLVLAEGEVTGARVQQDVDAPGRQPAARAPGDPGVLADLEAHGDAAAGEVEVPEGVELSTELELHPDLPVEEQAVHSRLEPAGHLVEAHSAPRHQPRVADVERAWLYLASTTQRICVVV